MLFKDSYLKILFTYVLNDTGIGGAKKKDLINRAAFKEHSLYLGLPVVVELLHGITSANEGGD